MNKLKSLLFIAVASLVAATLFTSCNEEESNIGMGLQDPATLFDGSRDTVYDLTAYTHYDDSLRTSGYSSAVLGYCNDAHFGKVTATYYTQMVNSNGVSLDEMCHIDSAILSLVITNVYSPSSNAKNAYSRMRKDDTYHLHFLVDQLATAPLTDSGYYAFDTIALSGNRYYDGIVSVAHADTMTVRLPLSQKFYSLLENQTLTASELITHLKGLRIAMPYNEQSRMVTVNLAAANTKLTVYYRYMSLNDTISRTLNLGIGTSATHFSHFQHDYSGTALSVFNTNHKDSIEGSQYLYLEPLGGTYISVDMHKWITQFRKSHPYATINYAVLKLPVANISDTCYPSEMYTYKRYADGSSIAIPDMSDIYTYTGYDGTNKYDKAYYRIRVTQHVQKMLLSGNDFGTLVYLEGRRSSPRRVIINGTGSNNRIRLEVVYSE